MANVFVTRGDLDGAMQLYQQSLEIKEGLGDLKGKAATLHNMAQIYVTRGDLDGAMQLYQQALQIDEGLGDLQGKAATLAMMAQIDAIQKNYRQSLSRLLEAFRVYQSIGAQPSMQNIANNMRMLKSMMQVDEFEKLWEELTNQPLPDWLNSKPEQGMTAEQFIAGAIQSARERRPEAEEYFKAAQQIAVDANVPKELQKLGRVLQRVMLGDKNVDLSGLREEWREMIERMKDEL
jgi:tetratricopeptide (TPR) repeat protein